MTTSNSNFPDFPPLPPDNPLLPPWYRSVDPHDSSEVGPGSQHGVSVLCLSVCLSVFGFMNKSNIVVFRKGGYLGARKRWVMMIV